MSWKYISSSVTGKSHLERDEQGQDYCKTGVIQISEKEFFIGIVADGAGSTKCGGLGAKIACETIFINITATLRIIDTLATISDEEILNWVISARDSIIRHSQDEGISLKEYASTLIGSIIGIDHSIFFQIGDGGIVVNFGSDYQTVFWPEQGEYANTTFFLSDESFKKHLNIKRMDSIPYEVSIFTDGLQNLVLSYSEKSAHSGFFKPLFEFLKKNPCNEFLNLSDQLNIFLNRTEFNERSDDDKTLILALYSTV
jgi:hypothetical protein